MTTQYTSLLGLALPVEGELSGTWGDTVNQQITQLVEDSVAGYATASVTSGNWTLTTTGSGASNQARMAILIPTGTPGVSRNIIAPSKSKAYLVINQSDAVVVLKGSATTGVSIDTGKSAICAWNGSDFVTIANVVGPDTATNNAIATYDGTTGKNLKNNSGATISSGVITASGFTGPLTGAVTATQVDLTAEGPVRWQDASGGQYVAFKAPATVPANVTWTLPSADGTSGQVLSTDGAGALSWATGSGGSGISAGKSITFALVFGI